MTSPAYSITTRISDDGTGGALLMGPQDPDFVRVIEDIHSLGQPAGVGPGRPASGGS